MASNAKPISAEIITTGTEILLGEIVDTNAAWIAQHLRDAGVDLFFKTTVGDNLDRLRSVIELGLTRSDVLIVSGGLGPTADDITRQAIAEAAGTELRLDAGALRVLEERFARFGAKMTDNNRQQALIPEGATLIPNPVGTAPGFILETDSGAIVAVPGVPREMMRLMQDTVLPYLRTRAGYDRVIRRHILRTVGIGESALDDLLGPLMLERNPTVGLAAKTAQVDIRITASDQSVEGADTLIEQVALEVRRLVGPYIYSETPGEELESVLVDLLADRNKTFAVYETNTAGRIAQRVRKQEGGRAVMPVAYSTDSGELPASLESDITERDASRESALDAARTLRTSAGTTFGLAVVGTCHPDGGIYGKGSGRTWIALTGEGIDETLELQYGGGDDYSATRIANQALKTLWENLRSLP